MTLKGRKGLGAAAVCAAGAVLLFHPLWLAAFGAGAWAGYRGKDWLEGILRDREAME